MDIQAEKDEKQKTAEAQEAAKKIDAASKDASVKTAEPKSAD